MILVLFLWVLLLKGLNFSRLSGFLVISGSCKEVPFCSVQGNLQIHHVGQDGQVSAHPPHSLLCTVACAQSVFSA